MEMERPFRVPIFLLLLPLLFLHFPFYYCFFVFFRFVRMIVCYCEILFSSAQRRLALECCICRQSLEMKSGLLLVACRPCYVHISVYDSNIVFSSILKIYQTIEQENISIVEMVIVSSDPSINHWGNQKQQQTQAQTPYDFQNMIQCSTFQTIFFSLILLDSFFKTIQPLHSRV